MHVEPIDIVCPECSAAATGRCLEKDHIGYHYINYFHQARIERAKELSSEGK